MSITPSIEALWNGPGEDSYVFASLFKRTYETSEIQERHTFEASEVHDIEGSISVAQTDYRGRKANCYVDYSFYWSTVKLSKGRQLRLCLVI